MSERISVTKAARNFSDMVNRVVYQGQSFILIRNGKAVAKLSEAEKTLTGRDLAHKWQERPRLDLADADDWARDLRDWKAPLKTPPETPWDS